MKSDWDYLKEQWRSPPDLNILKVIVLLGGTAYFGFRLLAAVILLMVTASCLVLAGRVVGRRRNAARQRAIQELFATAGMEPMRSNESVGVGRPKPEPLIVATDIFTTRIGADHRKSILLFCAYYHRIERQVFESGSLLPHLVEQLEFVLDSNAKELAIRAQLSNPLLQSCLIELLVGEYERQAILLNEHHPHASLEEVIRHFHGCLGDSGRTEDWQDTLFLLCTLSQSLFADAGTTAETRKAAWDQERLAQGALLRDIGGPDELPTLRPEWLTRDVVAIARTMYESQDFTGMPVLSDALEEAGCDSAAILRHCREPGVHVRGCWVVDLVLGKSDSAGDSQTGRM